MSRHLPELFDPWRYADIGRELDGAFLLQELPRLRACLHDEQGKVSFKLLFFKDDDRRAVASGKLQTELTLQCQRCMQEMKLAVNGDISLAFVRGVDEAGLLPESLDPYLVEDGTVSLRGMIEDDLLLALPLVAAHRAGECQEELLARSAETTLEEAAEKSNPFEILAELKRGKD